MFGMIQWKTSIRSSALNAARYVYANTPLKDGPLELILQPTAKRLRITNLPLEAFDHLIPLSVEFESANRLASEVMYLLNQDSNASSIQHQHLEHLINELETNILDLYPNLKEELRVRVRPLREQWEARGPGLVSAFGRQTGIDTSNLEVTAIMQHPVVGGDGSVFAKHGTVCIEAVLANEFFELPEVLRLGWLYCQNAALKISKYETENHALLIQLATLPAILSAGEQTELTRLDARTIEMALQHWRVSLPTGPDFSRVLIEWWNARDEQVAWQTAIEDLKRRVSS